MPVCLDKILYLTQDLIGLDERTEFCRFAKRGAARPLTAGKTREFLK